MMSSCASMSPGPPATLLPPREHLYLQRILPVRRRHPARCNTRCLWGLKQAAAETQGNTLDAPGSSPALVQLTASAPSSSPAANLSEASGSANTELVAVLLGYGVLVGSCFRSVPQIVKSLRAGSAEGLSLTSNVSEMLCYTVMVAYNFSHAYPFTTYGEIIACWLQDLVLVGLILRYMSVPPALLLACSAAFVGLCAWLFTPGACPPAWLSALQFSTLFVMAVGGRLPQIVLNIKRGNAGVMSLTTSALNVVGNVVRIFTTLVLTQDMLLLAGCVTGGILNAVILWQVWCTRVGERQQHQAAVA
ncbi:hypothetical protein V8C86DRAFT_2647007 [Haematococcus lacustris]